MNDEYERIREIKIKDGENIPNKPERMDPNVLLKRSAKLAENFSFLIQKNEEIKLHDEVAFLIHNIYLILESFVEMGINPTKFYNLVVDYNLKKIWPDGKLHYDQYGKCILPDGLVFAYDDARVELKRLSEGNVSYEHSNINDAFNETLMVHDKCGFSKVSTPSSLDNYRKYTVLLSAIHHRDKLLNADDLLDEVVALSKLLFICMETLAEMGINPTRFIDALIEKKEKKNKKK